MGVVVRGIVPGDEPAMVRFHEGLSDESVRYRYFCMMNVKARTAHVRLARICACEDGATVLVAETAGESGSEIVGVGRLAPMGDGEGELAIVVTDAWQRRGVGRKLIEALIAAAPGRGIRVVKAIMLTENSPMIGLCQRMGFAEEISDDWSQMVMTKVVG